MMPQSVCVGEALVPHVNKQVVGSEKISPEDGLLDVCNDEDILEHPTESQVECKQSIVKVGIEVPLTACRLR